MSCIPTKHHIVRITWNFSPGGGEHGAEYNEATVGEKGVRGIELISERANPGVYEITTEGEGDALSFSITIYNPCEVFWEERELKTEKE